MPKTDALGLDYCISTREVQLIQSQPVHSEYMHNDTTSEATLRLSAMCRCCVSSATCRCDDTRNFFHHRVATPYSSFSLPNSME